MRACVIFNPTACGERARRFKEALKGLAPPCELCPTTGPGAARDLARHAVERGHDVVIAAGGDGTVFEVLNGIADAPDGLARCALGVLPLGTANVLAHELRMPSSPVVAWEALMRGKFRQIDCGRAEFRDDGR
jgi:diacylglycerol kinase (ATP)